MTSVDGFVECDFVEYLADCLALETHDRPIRGQWSRVGNTIGALALRLNLMSEPDVDQVLEAQDTQGGYFGEIAVECGLLTPAQVSSLLDIQKMHDELNLGEQLVAAGMLDVPSLLNMMAQFLRESARPEPGTV